MRRRIRDSILISVVLASILLTACGSPESREQGMGNTNANITNGGMSVLRGDWIYFANVADNDTLYRIKQDGTGETRVSGDRPYSLNSHGEWLYFTSREDLKIYRIKPDGSDRTLVSEDGSHNVIVADGWVYFIKMNALSQAPDGTAPGDSSEYGRIFKLRTDGSGRQQVSGEMAVDFNLAEGWIYYVGTDDHKLHRMKTDGSENSVVSDVTMGKFSILDDHVYYIDPAGGTSRLWKMKLDGTGAVKLSDDKASPFNPSGGWIYYSNGKSDPEEYELKKMKLDGTEASVINNDYPVVINVQGDRLIYLVWYFKPFRMKQTIIKSDGTGRKDYDYVVTPP